MKIMGQAVLILFAMISVAQADQCMKWVHGSFPVTMLACSYPDGGSGYYKIINEGKRTAAFCWSVVDKSGRHMKRCDSNLAAGKFAEGSCSQCGSKKGGIQKIVLEKYEPK